MTDTRRPGAVVEIDGQPTHVVVEGAGPPVLLLAALGSNWFDLDALAADLASDFTVIRYDRPGYGLSASLPRDTWPTLDGEVRRIAAVLDHLDVREPVALAAHSMSSLYAEAFAVLHPDRTRAVMMIDGTFTLFSVRAVPTAIRVANCHRAADIADRVGLPARFGPAAHASILPTPPGGYDEDQRRWIRDVFRRSDMLRATLVENAAFPAIDDDLRTVRGARGKPAVPATVLAALGDGGGWRSAWRSRQRRYAQMLGATYEEISPAGHLVVITHPARVADALRRLVRRADGVWLRSGGSPDPLP
ncbi:alpha/beta fold hydrolase [Williamsia deligens]|uniref:Alpha/beta fold hydrolase n=1 Tax=Williamsia deligens TaxID=321325 RepID=A0ABW3G5H5_9NOCA|nr:alpha/beta hydrolase [Williamsia deligens]MCP2193896.1 Pimeloyl-ACP methyl ester carboxylesterase [Williamsia deligens]